jgi:hypothetical protein
VVVQCGVYAILLYCLLVCHHIIFCVALNLVIANFVAYRMAIIIIEHACIYTSFVFAASIETTGHDLQDM